MWLELPAAIVLSMLVPCPPMQPGTSGAPLLDHIQVACPHTLHQLSAVLEHVALMCEEHNKEAAAQGEPTPEAPLPASSPCPSLVVIDSVSAVVGPVLGMPQHGQGYTALASLGRQLRHLAQAHRLAVLVTNHVVASRTWEDKDGGGEPQQRAQPRRQAAQGGGAASAGGGRQLVPAMGESWRSQVHVRLTLALTPEGPEGPRRASLFTGAMVGSNCWRALQVGVPGVQLTCCTCLLLLCRRGELLSCSASPALGCHVLLREMLCGNQRALLEPEEL
jgi:hypothetical protein